jgi:hypothetical protein
MTPGHLEVSVPSSDRVPVEIELPDRTVSVTPGSSCRLTLLR